MQWLPQAALDPQDPDYADLLELQKLHALAATDIESNAARGVGTCGAGTFTISRRNASAVAPASRLRMRSRQMWRSRWHLAAGGADAIIAQDAAAQRLHAAMQHAHGVATDGQYLALALRLRAAKLHELELAVQGVHSQLNQKPPPMCVPSTCTTTSLLHLYAVDPSAHWCAFWQSVHAAVMMYKQACVAGNHSTL